MLIKINAGEGGQDATHFAQQLSTAITKAGFKGRMSGKEHIHTVPDN